MKPAAVRQCSQLATMAIEPEEREMLGEDIAGHQAPNRVRSRSLVLPLPSLSKVTVRAIPQQVKSPPAASGMNGGVEFF